MAINYDAMKSLYLNGKKVKTLYLNSKQALLSLRVSFNTNILTSGTNYYMSGQTCSVTTPATIVVPAGSAVGTLPTIGNTSYTLSGVAYTAYVSGWYLEPTCVNQVTASYVPSDDVTLYAKWVQSGNTNITGTGSFSIPKFSSQVAWSCSTNGGGRTAVSKSSTSSNNLALVMAAPGANKNSSSYTFTGAGGQTCTIASQSITVGSTTKSVSSPSNGATASAVCNPMSLATSSASSSTIFNSNNLKAVLSWPARASSGSYPVQAITATFYYSNTSKGSYEVCILRWRKSGDNYVKDMITDGKSTRTATFSSGNNGASGAYGCSKCGTSQTVSITAASGSGYSRTVTVKP